MPRRPPKRRLPWVAYLWPGLPHLWVRGSLAGLTLALAFSFLLNVLVMATLVWPAWLETRLKFGCGLAALGLWLAALYETRGELRRLAAERLAEAENPESPPITDENDPNEQLLKSAQASYLRGDWPSAEKSLRKALRRNRRDVEARLWLVMLLRRDGRLRQARRRLRALERLDDAAVWRHEIEQERALLTPSTDKSALTNEAPNEDDPTNLAPRQAAPPMDRAAADPAPDKGAPGAEAAPAETRWAA